MSTVFPKSITRGTWMEQNLGCRRCEYYTGRTCPHHETLMRLIKFCMTQYADVLEWEISRFPTCFEVMDYIFDEKEVSKEEFIAWDI